MLIIIFVNCAVMASEHHGQDPALKILQETLNVIFTLVFAGEFGAKLFGIGLVEYCSESANLFDGFIVVLSLVDLVMLIIGAGGGGGISVLRAFRLFRVFKLVRFFPSLQKQLTVLTNSIVGAGNFIVVLVLFLFIFTIMVPSPPMHARAYPPRTLTLL